MVRTQRMRGTELTDLFDSVGADCHISTRGNPELLRLLRQYALEPSVFDVIEVRGETWKFNIEFWDQEFSGRSCVLSWGDDPLNVQNRASLTQCNLIRGIRNAIYLCVRGLPLTRSQVLPWVYE